MDTVSLAVSLLVCSSTGEVWGSVRRWGFRRAPRHIGDRGGSGTGLTLPRCVRNACPCVLRRVNGG